MNRSFHHRCMLSVYLQYLSNSVETGAFERCDHYRLGTHLSIQKGHFVTVSASNRKGVRKPWWWDLHHTELILKLLESCNKVVTNILEELWLSLHSFLTAELATACPVSKWSCTRTSTYLVKQTITCEDSTSNSYIRNIMILVTDCPHSVTAWKPDRVLLAGNKTVTSSGWPQCVCLFCSQFLAYPADAGAL